MNENAKKWVEALESGEYAQGTGVLRFAEPGKDRFCCLGVACELYAQEHPVDGWEGDSGALEILGEDHVLPDVVRNWLGLRDDCGLHVGSSLTDLNDTGKSFKEIAKIIRSEPEGLFVEEDGS